MLSLVGAKTVNGPFPLRVITRSAAFNAVTSVVKLPAAIAVSTISAALAEIAETLDAVIKMRAKLLAFIQVGMVIAISMTVKNRGSIFWNNVTAISMILSYSGKCG